MPHQVLKPIPGHRSVIVEKIRNSATTARNCGNIWIKSKNNNPVRRPENRRRLKANAASADRKIESRLASPAIITELRNQCGKSVSSNSRVKLSSDAPLGTRVLDDSVPSGLSDAESTNRIGPSEKSTARMATR